MKVKVQNQESLQFDVDGLLTFNVAFGGNYYGVVLSKNFVSEGYAITKIKESEVPKDEKFSDLDKKQVRISMALLLHNSSHCSSSL